MAAGDAACVWEYLCLVSVVVYHRSTFENAFFIISTKAARQNSSPSIVPRFVFSVVQSLSIKKSTIYMKDSINSPNIRHVSICYCAPVKRLRTLHFTVSLLDAKKPFPFVSMPLKVIHLYARILENWLTFEGWENSAFAMLSLNSIHSFSIDSNILLKINRIIMPLNCTRLLRAVSIFCILFAFKTVLFEHLIRKRISMHSNRMRSLSRKMMKCPNQLYRVMKRKQMYMVANND